MIELLERPDGMTAEQRRRLEVGLERLIREAERRPAPDLPVAPTESWRWPAAVLWFLRARRR